MRTISFWQGLKSDDRGAAVVIGNFDGVHLGHQSVIDIARQFAGPNHPLGVLTFEPHPRQFFVPDAPAFRLMNSETRAHRLEKLGVTRLYELPFNAAMAALSPLEFARDVLAQGLGVSHVVVGSDFYFGKGRSGTASDLQDLGAELGFGVTVSELLHTTGREISSTAIRTALSQGQPQIAAEMLGHWHRIDGQVFGGDRRGREIGYPTANMSIQDLHAPKFGIYAVKVDVLTGQYKGTYDGAASIGVRPTFGDNLPNLETFIFDFSGDLYGEHLSVAFVEYLRPELKFDGIDALVEQMDKDCIQARQILAAI